MIIEDFSLTFDTDGFAEVVRYLPQKSTAISLAVLFDDKSVSSLDNLTLAPQIVVPLASFGNVTPTRGDTVEVKNSLYKILTPEPDGYGVLKLPLEYQSKIS